MSAQPQGPDTGPASEDAALLTLTQWLSPAFPLGSFAYSHGLETAIAEGHVSDAAGLEAWLGYVLCFGTGRSDAILIHACLRGEPVDDLATLARALAPSAERAREAEEQGAALARTIGALRGTTMPPRPLPVAFGAAARRLPVAPLRVVALYLQAFVGNLVSCATRAVPLGQTEAQAVLARLSQPILTTASATAETPVGRISSAAFGSDLSALRHETQDVRLYRT
ncbi:MAG: urease accessory UreF family protein [Pseudomonadota bacterium]